MGIEKLGNTVRFRNKSFDDAREAVVRALKAEGFGILTEIDVKATMKQKLGIEQQPYRILGACNPTFAHEALGVEPLVGLLLPCNVIVYETDDQEVVVSVVEPEQMFKLVERDDMAPLVEKVKGALGRVASALLEDGAVRA